MNLIASKVLTMSSKSIAELTGKEHKNVTRTIKWLFEQNLIAQIEPLKYEHRGNYYDYYELDKRSTMVLVAKLSPEFMVAVIDRWQELENSGGFKVPQTMAEALRLAADQQEQIENLASKIKQDAPKVEYVNNYMQGEGLRGLQEAAKSLGFKPRLFIERLEGKWLYRSNEKLMPYQKYIDNGIFKVVEGERNGITFNQSKITPKGMVYFSVRLNSELGN